MKCVHNGECESFIWWKRSNNHRIPAASSEKNELRTEYRKRISLVIWSSCNRMKLPTHICSILRRIHIHKSHVWSVNSRFHGCWIYSVSSRIPERAGKRIQFIHFLLSLVLLSFWIPLSNSNSQIGFNQLESKTNWWCWWFVIWVSLKSLHMVFTVQCWADGSLFAN